MCFSLRRSMMTESASAVVIVGATPWVSVAGEGEEYVIEVGSVHGHLGGVDAVLVEDGEDAAQFWHAAGGNHEREFLRVGPPGPGDDFLSRPERADVGERQPDVPAGNHPLELFGGALRDQGAVVKQRDLVGELIGLLQVLGGEEDRDTAA